MSSSPSCLDCSETALALAPRCSPCDQALLAALPEAELRALLRERHAAMRALLAAGARR